jgi:hypothetical protein
MIPEVCLSDQPSVLVWPDGWHVSILQESGGNAASQANAATPKKSLGKVRASKNGTALKHAGDNAKS